MSSENEAEPSGILPPKTDAFDYIERFYNPKRGHSTIGYMSPTKFEMKIGLA